MGGINNMDQFKYQVSIRALTHLSQEDYNKVCETFDNIITECNADDLKLDKNDDDVKTMYIWLELHKHQKQLDEKSWRSSTDKDTADLGTSHIVFDGYKSVKLFTDW